MSDEQPELSQVRQIGAEARPVLAEFKKRMEGVARRYLNDIIDARTRDQEFRYLKETYLPQLQMYGAMMQECEPM